MTSKFSFITCHPKPTLMWGTHLLFICSLFADGWHLWSRNPLAGAALQQVNPWRSRALLVLKVEKYILIKREVFLVPAAVFRRFLTQIAALNAVFARDRGQKEDVPFVIANALLHLLHTQECHTEAIVLLKHWRWWEVQPRAQRVKGTPAARNA